MRPIRTPSAPYCSIRPMGSGELPSAGTISSGVLLLREIDPQLKTPAANNLITGSSFAILLGVVLLVFVGMAPKSVFMTFLTFGLILVYYLILVFFIVRKPRKEKS